MSNSLQNTIDHIVPFCRYQRANIGTNGQPIIGIANTVRNIISAAPMIWDWNRNENNSITTSVGLQDYIANIPDFGFLEKVSIKDTDGKYYEIADVKNNSALSKSSTTARPQVVAVQNGTGPVIRFSGVPDKIYSVNLVYQITPVQFVNVTDLWAPIPDSYSDIYNNMCLGYYMDSCQDPRAAQYVARGIAGLLSRQSGLSEMDKAIFAQSYMNLNSAMLTQTLGTQQGKQAQGAR